MKRDEIAEKIKDFEVVETNCHHIHLDNEKCECGTITRQASIEELLEALHAMLDYGTNTLDVDEDNNHVWHFNLKSGGRIRVKKGGG